MEKKFRVLAINPGSTSTKVGIYEGEKMLYEGTVRHSREELAAYPTIYSQKFMRMALVKKLVEENGYKVSEMDAFIGRGGIIRPLAHSGVYAIGEKLKDDLMRSVAEAQKRDARLPGLSVGYARADADCEDISAVFKAADQAMYDTKKARLWEKPLGL